MSNGSKKHMNHVNLSGRTPLLCAHTSHLCQSTDPVANCSERVWLELPVAGNVALRGDQLSRVLLRRHLDSVVFVTGPADSCGSERGARYEARMNLKV